MFRQFVSRALLYLWPPRLLAGLGRILSEWQGADVREKGILLLVFAPMLLCILGLLFSVTSFVLFVLPSFVLRILGWAMLTALFGGGGIYFHDRLKKHTSGRGEQDFYDVTEEPEPRAPQGESAPNEEKTPAWFENVRRMRWRE